MATTDPLTGLVNRRAFERRLEEALEATQGGARHVLCYLDLDRFRVVNDEAGTHLAGDAMLCEVATLIKDAVGESDVVGRLGGDEFGILLAGCPLENARQIVDDVVRAVTDHRFVWKDKTFSIGVNIGLVEVTAASSSTEDLVHAADSACCLAKNQDSHVHVYSARDEADARQRGEILWLQLLQSALKDDRFELHAKPIVHPSAQQAGGTDLEILLRLKDGKGNSFAPAEFMGVAEHHRLMPLVDRWVVQTSLTLLTRGAIRLAPDRRLCINLSGQALGDASFLGFVVDGLDRTGVATNRVCFIVPEGALSPDMDSAQAFVRELRSRGCTFVASPVGGQSV